jgi:hypothetical protein
VVTKLQRELLLAGVALALGASTYTVYVEWPGTSTASSPASNLQEQRAPGTRADRKAQAGRTDAEAPDVHLDALAAQRTKPGQGGRDLFRFREKPPPPPPPPLPPRVLTPAEQAAANAPPPPPPIALKFIGFVDAESAGGKRLAFLSDGRGSPLSGHEGDTVLGQYRILRIGAESIEMSYLDGRGRQTIRLSGS